jgi:hypothetical protein
MGMLLLGDGAKATPEGNPAPVTAVVELFTSQGCSSCPTADALLESYTQRRGILAVSFAVDYWDYLGWKDTLSDPKFTKRQRAYARTRGDGQVYTPQIVVNGIRHVIGGQKAAIDSALADTAAVSSKTWVPLTITSSGEHLTIEAGAGAKADATLWLVMMTRKIEVPVKRGENAGKTLAYHNVVRDISPIGMWNGQAMVVRLDRRSLAPANAEFCAVILQQGHGGRIIGAAVLPRW